MKKKLTNLGDYCLVNNIYCYVCYVGLNTAMLIYEDKDGIQFISSPYKNIKKLKPTIIDKANFFALLEKYKLENLNENIRRSL